MQIPGSNEKPSALIMDNEHPKRSVHGGIIIIMCLPPRLHQLFYEYYSIVTNCDSEMAKTYLNDLLLVIITQFGDSL